MEGLPRYLDKEPLRTKYGIVFQVENFKYLGEIVFLQIKPKSERRTHPKAPNLPGSNTIKNQYPEMLKLDITILCSRNPKNWRQIAY